MAKGKLYVVATPIGNLEDVTLRAIRTLKEVDVIAAEDTRHSRKLLAFHGITKPLTSYWSENERMKAGVILERLHSGFSVALISDAGTPGISDPGAQLITRAIDEGVDVIPIPGPSALIAALSVSGLGTEEFTFVGFLPPKSSQRQKKLRDLSLEARTLVFYEAPHRITETLADMKEILGSRRAVVVKELTKMHEEVVRGSLPEILRTVEDRTIAGEYVIVVEGRKREFLNVEEAMEEMRSLIRKGRGRKEAAKMVAEEYGLSASKLYDRSLEVAGGESERT